MSSNDYHIDEHENLQAGLGSDEPDDEMKEAMKSRGMSTVLKLRKQVEEQRSALTEKERELADISRAQEIERKKLDADRKALDKEKAEHSAKGK